MKTNARTMLENDPRLTAYALGELAGDDAAAVEALLADSLAALAEVEAIRGTAASIRGVLGGTAAGLTLSEAGRAAILESAVAARAPARVIRHPLLRWGTTLTAAAASLALVATLWRAPGATPDGDRRDGPESVALVMPFADAPHDGANGSLLPQPARPNDGLSDELFVASLYGNPNLPRLSEAPNAKPSDAYLIHGRRQVVATPQPSSEGRSVAYLGQANAQPRPIRPNEPPTNDSYFGRSTTPSTFDEQGNSEASDWTGSEVSADAVGAGSIWHASDPRDAPAAPGRNHFDFRGSAHLSWGYPTPDGSRGRPTQSLDSLSVDKPAGVRDPNSAAYRHNMNVPSSEDTDVDLRYPLGDIPVLRVLSDDSISFTGSPKQIEAIQDALDLLEEDADGDGVPWQQDVLYPTPAPQTSSSASGTAIRDQLRSGFAKEVASRDVVALQNAARELSAAGRFGEAEQVTRLALEVDPGNEDLERNRASCMEREAITRRLEERRAILHRQRTEKINQLYQLAESFRRNGDFGQAASAVGQVRLLDPQNPSIATTLAQIQQEDRASRDNPFLESLCRPLSTFSIDVDTAAYSLVRQTLVAGQLPQPESVRIEELVNYFDYDYPPPSDDRPFAANLEIAACPWQPAHRLVRVGLKGQVVQAEQRPVANLVFLIDVSGSMNEPAKLPMVKNSLRMLVEQLFDDDRVAIVVYAGAAGLVLPSTPASQRETILAAIDNLSAGGSTDGGSGITLAYDVAAQNFLSEGINRVVLATDGDFNVGITDRGQLETLIAERAKTGVFLTTLGYGYGNMNDKTLETLADKGNGNYAIIDSLDEAKKVLVDNVSGTLHTIAKDVKIQVEFNPAAVAGYRLIGYENRMLAARDFNDDSKDAGEIGAGHTVTALYEVVPVGHKVPPMSEAALAKLPPEDSLRGVLSDGGVDPLKYQTPGGWMQAILPPAEIEKAEADEDVSQRRHADDGGTQSAWHPADVESSDNIADAEVESVKMPEMMTLKLRYKLPDGDVSTKTEFAVQDSDAPFDAASDDFRFAAAVAAYGMLLRNSIYAGEINMAGVSEIASGALGIDESGRRAEFVELAKRAGALLDGATKRE